MHTCLHYELLPSISTKDAASGMSKALQDHHEDDVWNARQNITEIKEERNNYRYVNDTLERCS